MAQVNRYLEALKENGNLVGITSVVAASLALLTPLPLLVGLAAEVVYLLFVPDSKWYDSRLSRKNDAEVIRRRKQLRDQVFPMLHPEMQARFAHLEEMRDQINAQAKDDEKWFLEVLRKLDYLLEKFLMFATREAKFRNYLAGVWEESQSGLSSRPAVDDSARSSRYIGDSSSRRASGKSSLQLSFASSTAPVRGAVAKWVPQVVNDVQAYYQAEIDKLHDLQKTENDDNTKAVLDKRAEVLKQRQEFAGKIGRILTNLNYQMELLEDTFGLINDQIRARSPEQVLSDIEGVVYQTESMTQLLEELAPYEQMAESTPA